jgi:hypothetical protein
MEEQQIKTITVDGVEHDLASFPQEVQQLVAIHQRWEVKKVEAKLELAMVEAALRDLTKELSDKIKVALTPEVEEVTAEAEEVSVAE